MGISEDCFISKEGQISTDHNYIWLKNLSSFGTLQKDIGLDEISCNVIKPLSITTLLSLITIEKCLEHNFLSAVLFMGVGAIIFHYYKILELLKFCPQIMAVGLYYQLAKQSLYRLQWHSLVLITLRITTTHVAKPIACRDVQCPQFHWELMTLTVQQTFLILFCACIMAPYQQILHKEE